MVGLSPLKIPNCQFKVFRENSLTSNRERETHARILQENKLQILKININIPNILPKPPLPVDEPTLPVVPVDEVPNCEIERQLIR